LEERAEALWIEHGSDEPRIAISPRREQPDYVTGHKGTLFYQRGKREGGQDVSTKNLGREHRTYLLIFDFDLRRAWLPEGYKEQFSG